MRVLIFTEASSVYGYGHLMRCLAIAQGFQEKQFSILFVMRGEGPFIELLNEFSVEQKEWLEADFLNRFIKPEDITVVDSYYASQNICEIIYRKAKKTVFFDDYNRIPYPGGFVLNGAIGAENIEYPEEKTITYLLGTEYQPVRKEFWSIGDFEIRPEIQKILITFGGSDMTNQTANYIDIIRSLYPRCQLNIIIGPGFGQLLISQIKKVCNELCKLIFKPDLSEFIRIMRQCDLAVSAAGQTLNELAIVGVPTFAVKIADNQKVLLHNWKISGFLLNSLYPEYLTMDIRKKSSLHGKQNIDGQGTRRVVQNIL